MVVRLHPGFLGKLTRAPMHLLRISRRSCQIAAPKYAPTWQVHPVGTMPGTGIKLSPPWRWRRCWNSRDPQSETELECSRHQYAADSPALVGSMKKPPNGPPRNRSERNLRRTETEFSVSFQLGIVRALTCWRDVLKFDCENWNILREGNFHVEILIRTEFLLESDNS